MASVVLTGASHADVARIIDDLNRLAGASVADRYDASFDMLYRRLAGYPDSGAPRPKLGAQVRISAVSPYIVIHEHAKGDDAVTILRMLIRGG